MKKVTALFGVLLLFSGAGFDNKANINEIKEIHTIYVDPTISIDKLVNKTNELDSLLIELQKYEKK